MKEVWQRKEKGKNAWTRMKVFLAYNIVFLCEVILSPGLSSCESREISANKQREQWWRSGLGGRKPLITTRDINAIVNSRHNGRHALNRHVKNICNSSIFMAILMFNVLPLQLNICRYGSIVIEQDERQFKPENCNSLSCRCPSWF